MNFSICGILGQFCGANQTRYMYWKTVFFPSKRSQNKVFPVKTLAFKIFILSFPKVANFARFSKNHVLSFLLMSGLCHINGAQ